MSDDFKRALPPAEVCPCSQCTPKRLKSKPKRIARKNLRRQIPALLHAAENNQETIESEPVT